MRPLAVLAFFALALVTGTGCSDNPGGHEDSEVHLTTGASNHTPEVGDQVVLNADITTEGDVTFISFNWITVTAPAIPVFQNSTNSLSTVRFTQPGLYRITMRVYWWNWENDRKTTDSTITIDVAPAAPVAGG